jgi:hypothetical protein
MNDDLNENNFSDNIYENTLRQIKDKKKLKYYEYFKI